MFRFFAYFWQLNDNKTVYETSKNDSVDAHDCLVAMRKCL